MGRDAVRRRHLVTRVTGGMHHSPANPVEETAPLRRTLETSTPCHPQTDRIALHANDSAFGPQPLDEA
jgi:hypothetical protein